MLEFIVILIVLLLVICIVLFNIKLWFCSLFLNSILVVELGLCNKKCFFINFFKVICCCWVSGWCIGVIKISGFCKNCLVFVCFSDGGWLNI